MTQRDGVCRRQSTERKKETLGNAGMVINPDNYTAGSSGNDVSIFKHRYFYSNVQIQSEEKLQFHRKIRHYPDVYFFCLRRGPVGGGRTGGLGEGGRQGQAGGAALTTNCIQGLGLTNGALPAIFQHGRPPPQQPISSRLGLHP